MGIGDEERAELRRSTMPQRAWDQKRERQYEHIKESLEEQGKSEEDRKSVV